MDPLELTTTTTRDQSDGTVKGLAWKLLYANHRPSLGPDRWAQLVDEVDGPRDIKELDLTRDLPAEPFQSALWALDAELGDGDGSHLQAIGTAAAERWATMFQRLTDHLEGQPARMLELACQEVLPWFFGEACSADVVQMDERSARLRIAAPLPEAFLAGWLEGTVAVVGADARVDRSEDGFTVSWTPVDVDRPSTVSILLQATRAAFLPATLAPVLVGTALAAWQGSFQAPLFGLALAGAVLLHLAFNLLNDVLDHRRGVDEANLTPTPFGGGSRVIQRGLMGSDAMLGLAAGLALIGSGIGVLLSLQIGLPILALGLAGVGLGYAYSGAPFRLADRGLGEATAALVFGPLLTAGAHAVQTGAISLDALWAGLPVGLFMGAFLMVNELPDAPWDTRTGRRTLVVRMGELAPWGAGLALLTPYPMLGVLVALGVLPAASLVALATVPFALLVGHRVRVAGHDADAVADLQGSALLLHATTGVLMAAGIAWGVLA